MKFVKYNVLRKLLMPLYGKSFTEKCRILWKEGWEQNPVPTLTIVLFPFLCIHTAVEYYFHDTSKRKRKYLSEPPIYRPGDPRIADIQHYSGLDN